MTIHNELNGILTVNGVRKEYQKDDGSSALAIEGVTFGIGHGEFVCLVGPSGCGKTTLLKILCGLISPSAGEVRFKGNVITKPPRGLALVSQDYTRSLLPWLSAEENVALPLEARGVAKGERLRAAREALANVGLVEYARHAPWEMSGGMQQRVAIARAIASKPELMLMDEPFASVDAQTRANLEDLVADLYLTLKIPTVLVTHDIDEAVYLADRVIVLSKRPSVVQMEKVVELERPRNQLRTRGTEDFIKLRSEILSMILES